MSLIGYHFGGLEQLLATVMITNVDRFLEYGAALLQKLFLSGEEITLERLLSVYIQPLHLSAAFHSDATAVAVIYEIYRRAKPPLREDANEKLLSHVVPFTGELRRLLPHLDQQTLIWRLNAVSAIAIDMAPHAPLWEMLAETSTLQMVDDERANLDEILHCAIAILKAPMTVQTAAAI